MIMMMSSQPSATAKSQVLGFSSLLGLFGEIGLIIALPAVIFGFVGVWADKNYGTLPLLTISGFLLAILVSGVAVYRRIKPFLYS